MPLFETGSTIEGAGGRRIICSFLDKLLQGACEASVRVRTQALGRSLAVWNRNKRKVPCHRRGSHVLVATERERAQQVR